MESFSHVYVFVLQLTTSMGGNYQVYSVIKLAYDLGQLVRGIIGQRRIIRADISLISIMVCVCYLHSH